MNLAQASRKLLALAGIDGTVAVGGASTSSAIATSNRNNIDDRNNTVEASTPVKVVQASDKEKHRIVFNEQAFSVDKDYKVIDMDKHKKQMSKVLSQDKWKTKDELKNLSDIDRQAYQKWKTAHGNKDKNSYRWHEKYTVFEKHVPGEAPEMVLKRIEPNRVEANQQQHPDRRLVIPMPKIFDAIYEMHKDKSGHMGQERTSTAVSEKYYSVSQTQVVAFCRTCRTCVERQPAIKPHQGAKKPIHSTNWRDRFQVDLIDMRKFAQRDIYGIVQRWIIVLKDHFSGLTYITSIPRKRAKYVAHELNKIFGLIGYPNVFHTDNGKEFTAKVVIAMLRELNPNILTVTGRPRTPRDQGCVENMNKLVKKILFSMLSDSMREGKDTNWTYLLPRITAVVNSNKSRGKNSVTAYETVFGQSYDQELSCTLDDARKCYTVTEKLKVSHDDRIASLFVSDDKASSPPEDMIADGDTDGYWSDSSQPLNVVYELKDEQKLLNDMIAEDDVGQDNDDKQASETLVACSAFKSKQASSEGPKALQSSDSSMTVDSSKHKSPPAMGGVACSASKSKQATSEGPKALQSSDSSMTVDASKPKSPPAMASPPQVESITARSRLKLSEEAQAWVDGTIDLSSVPAPSWAFDARIEDEDVNVTNTCNLDCIIEGFTLLSTYDDELSHELTNENQLRRILNMIRRREYDKARLVWIAHCEKTNRGTSQVTKTRGKWNCFGELQYFINPLPGLFRYGYCLDFDDCSNGEIVCENTMCYNDSDEDRSVYALRVQHHRHIPIYPSHLHQIQMYLDSIFNTGVEVDCGEESCRTKSGSVANKGKCNGKRLMRKVIQQPMPVLLCLERGLEKDPNQNSATPLTSIDQLDHNIVVNGQKYKLVYIILGSGTHFCSITTIAGRHLLYDDCETPKLRWIEASDLESLSFGVEQLWYRKEYDYESPVKGSVSDGNAKDGNAKDTSGGGGADDINEDNKEDTTSYTSPQANDPNTTQSSSTDSRRQSAVNKRRAYKAHQAEKMVARHIRHLTDSGVNIGAVITVQVDYRDVNTHSRGIVGIVCGMSSFGSVLVVSEHGVLANGTSLADYWIPSDKYKLQYKPTEYANISDKLETIRQQIIDGTFGFNEAERVSLPKAHQLTVGASSPCRKGNCGCQRGNCTKRCGCRSANPPRACSSSCSCNGNCTGNPLNECNIGSD